MWIVYLYLQILAMHLVDLRLQCPYLCQHMRIYYIEQNLNLIYGHLLSAEGFSGYYSVPNHL